jgi:cytidine deaminase
MKKMKIETAFTVYDNEQELPPAYLHVLNEARAARKDAYAPYSNFFVGAAALLDNGALVKGANQENAAYPICMCAERVALGSASMLHQDVPISVLAIAVHNPNKKLDAPAAPCGSCRQAICEMEYRQQKPIKILLPGKEGTVLEFASGKSLLPLNFNGDFL